MNRQNHKTLILNRDVALEPLLPADNWCYTCGTPIRFFCGSCQPSRAHKSGILHQIRRILGKHGQIRIGHYEHTWASLEPMDIVTTLSIGRLRSYISDATYDLRNNARPPLPIGVHARRTYDTDEPYLFSHLKRNEERCLCKQR